MKVFEFFVGSAQLSIIVAKFQVLACQLVDGVLIDLLKRLEC